ncbi:hypothetical protein [Streptomyces sp. NPDC018584]|uniref:hypothetical protein n=1 Tax=unclassified Streptomyces TaxID=2593676 RepID=UPI0037B521C6
MAIYAEVRKVSEDETQVRYSFSDGAGTERFMTLDKVAEKSWPEDGVNNVLYQAVARKVAVAWLRQGEAPERLMVAS